MSTIKHTKWPWHEFTTEGNQSVYAPDYLGIHSGPVAKATGQLWVGNRALIALAPTAPHECSPECPGEVNRRKLDALDRIVAAYTLAESSEDVGETLDAQAELETALAAAREVVR